MQSYLLKLYASFKLNKINKHKKNMVATCLKYYIVKYCTYQVLTTRNINIKPGFMRCIYKNFFRKLLII